MLLKDLNADQASFIALLAKSARTQRDALLGNVAERDLAGPAPARGERNPTADLGLQPIPSGSSQTEALREAVAGLTATARRELYALMRIGQGHLAAKKWHRGLTEAELLGDNTITAEIIDDADLHDHLSKGLYEANLAS